MVNPILIPDLQGALRAIQYINHQPNLPAQTMPSEMPKMGHAAQMPGLPNIPQQRAPQQQDQQSPFGGGNSLQGLMNSTGFNPNYYLNSVFGNAHAGQTISPFNVGSNIGLSDISLPSLGSFSF